MKLNPRRVLALLAVTAVVVGVTAACTPAAQTPAGAADQEFTLATTSPLQGWDPYKCLGATRNILVSAYDSLTRITPDGRIEPSLATAWEYESPTRFVLTLRDDVAFEDGTVLDADVVKANLDRAAAEPTAITAQFAQNEPQITVTSDTELAIDLHHPDPDLPYLFSQCGGMIVHPDLVADPARLASEVEGTGPYTFDADASISDSTYVFTKKPDYWNTDAYPFAKVTFTVIPDSNAMLSALLSGQVDVAPGNFQAAPQVEGAGLSAVHGNVSMFTILLNDRSGEQVPALADQRVRQALNYAVDREAIIQTLFGGNGVPTPQIPRDGVTGYDAALDDRYPYDPERAKQLLADAGYPDGFTMTVLTAGVNQMDTFLAAVADYWAKVGVQVTQQVSDPGTYLAAVATTEYPAVFNPLKGASIYSVLNRYFGPTAGYNPFGSTDPELADNLEKAANGDEDAVHTASERLLDLGWYVGVGFDAQYYFFDPETITGIQMQLDDTAPLFYDWQPAS